MGNRLIERTVTAFDEQIVMPVIAAAETSLPRLADSMHNMLLRRHQVATEVHRRLGDHLPAKLQTSMPGIGVRTAARILLEVGVGSPFAPFRHPQQRGYVHDDLKPLVDTITVLDYLRHRNSSDMRRTTQ
jgi:hypothetical protein